MKAAIETMLNSYVCENASYIRENGGNAANYIISDAEAMDQGWLWFLTEGEIEEYRSDKEARNRLIQEIKDYVNTYYNYKV